MNLFINTLHSNKKKKNWIHDVFSCHNPFIKPIKSEFQWRVTSDELSSNSLKLQQYVALNKSARIYLL